MIIGEKLRLDLGAEQGCEKRDWLIRWDWKVQMREDASG